MFKTRRKVDSALLDVLGGAVQATTTHSVTITFSPTPTAPDLEIVVVGEGCILEDPIEQWPRVDCLLSWSSDGFPLKKGLAYEKLCKPRWISNTLQAHPLLSDRSLMFERLESLGIPTLRHGVVRDGKGLVEYADSIVVDGLVFEKPFVEKPLDADDHNVRVYYRGGGCRQMFRKTKERSSVFMPDVSEVRRNGCYLYEDFMPSDDGLDIKVYAVGSYAHAEGRKAPTIDGIVDRRADGKEQRHNIRLTDEERDIACRVSAGFYQTVCGFDVLRVKGRPLVCDVNGWSFVKACDEYYEECSRVLLEGCNSLS